MDVIDLVRARVRSAAHAHTRAHLLGSDQVGRLQGVQRRVHLLRLLGRV